MIKLFFAKNYDALTQQWVGVVFRQESSKIIVLATEVAKSQIEIDDWGKTVVTRLSQN